MSDEPASPSQNWDAILGAVLFAVLLVPFAGFVLYQIGGFVFVGWPIDFWRFWTAAGVMAGSGIGFGVCLYVAAEGPVQRSLRVLAKANAAGAAKEAYRRQVEAYR